MSIYILMKRILLTLVLIYLTACTTSPVKKEEVVVVPPKKTVVKEPSKPFLNYIKNEDKKAFDEIKDEKKILYVNSAALDKATKNVNFWVNLDTADFNSEFSANMYNKDGNDFIYRVCSSAQSDKTVLLDFLSYNSVVDDAEEDMDLESTKDRYEPLVIQHTSEIIDHCQKFKEIICKDKKIKVVRGKAVTTFNSKKVRKANLEKDLLKPELTAEEKQKRQNLWYEMNFCEAAQFIK